MIRVFVALVFGAVIRITVDRGLVAKSGDAQLRSHLVELKK